MTLHKFFDNRFNNYSTKLTLFGDLFRKYSGQTYVKTLSEKITESVKF